jgi:hypothetical protein
MLRTDAPDPTRKPIEVNHTQAEQTRIMNS